MIFDPEKLSPRDFYRHLVCAITPRPIAWVSTVSPNGVRNLAPFSFFNGVGANPPAVMFSVTNTRTGARKDTLRNIEATGEFVVNVVSASLAGPMNETSAELPYETDEFSHAGLTAVESVKVKPARVAESHVAMECRLHQIVPVGNGPLAGNVIVGTIVMMHVDDTILDAAGAIDAGRLDTIARMGGALYSYTRQRFELERPG